MMVLVITEKHEIFPILKHIYFIFFKICESPQKFQNLFHFFENLRIVTKNFKNSFHFLQNLRIGSSPKIFPGIHGDNELKKFFNVFF